MRIFVPKWMELISEVGEEKDAPISQLAKKMDVTYSHICQLIKELEEMDFLKSIKTGRVRIVELTVSGQDLKLHAKNLKLALGDDYENRIQG